MTHSDNAQGIPGDPSLRDRLKTEWAHASLIWLIVTAADIGFSSMKPQGALRYTLIPLAARASVITWNLILSAGVLLIYFVLRALVCQMAQRYTLDRWQPVHVPLLLLWRFVRLLAVAIFVFLYLAGWTTFHQTGRFLDFEAFAFWWNSPNIVLTHLASFSPTQYVGVPVLTLLSAWLIGQPARHLVRDPQRKVRSFAVNGMKLGITAAVLLTLIGQVVWAHSSLVVTDPLTNIRFQRGDLFRAARDHKAGPFAELFADVRDAWHGEQGGLPQDPRLPTRRSPQIPMQSYVSAINQQQMKRYNVILVLVESMRADQLLEFGGSREVMPNVEAVAQQSVLFTNAYSQASHSDYADPGPSSSMYPLRTGGTYPEHPPYPRVFIYDVLKALGYRTASVSSQNDAWGNLINLMETGGLDYVLHSENYKGETYVAREDSFFAEWVKGNKHAGKIDDRFTVGEAIKWIDSGKSPFFLLLNLQNSHIPYEVPADFPRYYSKKNEDFEFTFAYLKPEQVQNARDRYADSLRYLDFQLGRLIAHLKETRQWDNTVFVLTGDHGQGFMEHGFFTHGRELYNEVMRVPLVVHAPGFAPHSDARLAQHVDVPPTICQVLGIPPHPAWQGEGLLSDQPTAGKEVFMVVQTPFAHQYAMVRGSHKLIYDRREERTFLFDLQGDPGEMHDIAAASPTLLRKLSERLGTWRMLQNGYYRSDDEMKHTYPPVLLPDANLTTGY